MSDLFGTRELKNILIIKIDAFQKILSVFRISFQQLVSRHWALA